MREVLFLAHRVPFPPDRGDRIRSYHVLRHLSERARVHVVAFAEDGDKSAPPQELADRLASITLVPRTKSQARAAIEALATGQPVSLTAFGSAAMRKAVEHVLSRPGIDRIYAFSGQMAQYLPENAPIVMDFVDMDSAKFAAYAATARGPLRWMMRREARLLGGFERAVAARVHASLFVSEAEAALFRAGGGGGRIVAVENGIDAAAFDPGVATDGARDGPPVPTGPLVVFTGQMDYRPNVEAVCWFVAAVLPRLREVHPDLRFAIVGRAPTEAVTVLASDAVIVTGAVDDVRPWLAAADVCVAPLMLARGIQNKVLEAMAMARPVVASVAAAEGIDHAGTLRVADDAEDHAAAILTLLADPASAAALGQAARARVLARYDWAARLAPLDALLDLSA